ncbi:MAG: ABC transporter permease [Phycisphaerales bacterium]
MLVLGLKMLLGDPAKYAGVLSGILLTTFLIMHLLSMFIGLISRTYAVITDIPEADIWVMDAAVEYVDEIGGLPPTTVERVRGVEGVDWAVPLYTGTLRTRLSSGHFRNVAVIGIDDASLIGAPRNLIGCTPADLRRADSAIVDLAATDLFLRQAIDPQRHGRFDPDAPTRPLVIGDELSINDRRITVVGFARVAPRFLFRPTIYMTYSHALATAPAERRLLSFVLVKARAGIDPRALAEHIGEVTGLRARTSAQFKADTAWYVTDNGGVIVRLGIMVGIAVAIGALMTGLLLYLFTIENLRYYATFKALGTPVSTVVSMVAVQSLVSGAIGFGLGAGCSALLGMVMVRIDQPFLLVWPTLVFAGLLVLIVCVLAGMLSASKVARADAAVVFK